ncbi:probable pectinesterase/pectinesterase inhibitor 34 [Impatiens glandulifera]|uniref:probable pectinesterase/pectinesterase inhibitor 34 n=1 Tax=Impatiens glandulifera TaxID=253017 RepID=UPI001FB1289A|nr:probable pectinesterase/pectinesterase inhibitor 34 [Impatiens glandulifera]
MGYGRLGNSTESAGGGSSVFKPDIDQLVPASSTSSSLDIDHHRNIKPTRGSFKKLLIFSIVLILAAAVSAAFVVGLRTRGSYKSLLKQPTRAITMACSRTLHPELCVKSLLDFPGASTANEKDLIHITVNMTLQRFDRALYVTSGIGFVNMDPHLRSAYDDCLELLDDAVDHLSKSLSYVAGDGTGSTHDVMTWLSSALTNQDTCTDGLSEVSGSVKDQMEVKLKDLSELVSNCLAIYAAAIGSDDFAGVPIQNRRRRRILEDARSGDDDQRLFPSWVGKRERYLLDAPVAGIQADIVVSKDGNGTVKTIEEAIKKAPESSSRRTIIYVKAGRYEENNLKVGRKKKNLMFIGDGKGKTVITGGNSVFDKMTTFHTASFAATGEGFIARDITFENYAGPGKHQAVALRIGADHAVVYRSSVIGYQDTLYVHSNRQFFRECDVYGTVDFIFGNAAVVFQNCSLYARKPMNSQKVTITAQNRKDPNQNTGISIHACRILATSDLEASKGSFPTFLGRPWKLYSRTVYMQSYIGDHVHPRGWLEWNATFALDTLYYGEYANTGPGSALGGRVKWPGYVVITTTAEASKFTVGQFIYGSAWLPSTGVAFLAGLSV